MLISDITRQAARRYGDAPCLVAGERSLTFAEFDAATNRLANALFDRGLVRGDRLTMLLPNGLEFFVVSHALARAGLVQVPLNSRETVENHRQLMDDSGARAMIGDCTNAKAVEMRIEMDELWSMIDGGAEGDVDLSVGEGETYRLAYTGGTTGPPKAVESTPRQRTAEIASFLTDLMPDLGPGSRVLHAGPVTHASGDFFLPSFIRGGCNHVLPGFKPAEFLEQLERTAATHTFLVPTMLAMLLAEPGVEDADTSALEAIFWAGSPLAPATSERSAEVFGPKLRGTYGQAEAPMALTYLLADEHDRHGCAGSPYRFAEVRVLDPDDQPVADGEAGEVCARGDLIMKGYWNRPGQTAETLRNGWLHTGDIGRFDEDGYLYLLDRAGDMIISGGFNVYPREIEELLMTHPAVREVAVVGIPDDTWGEEVNAVVSAKGDLDPDDLLEFCRSRTAGFKRPRRVTVLEELPKSGAGKIVRRLARDAVAPSA
jgi:acyl-CoA synthetase (AMP-forming)/AMP-acid ligase II